MSDAKFQEYIIDLIALLKERAMDAKKEADNPKEGLKDYARGLIMGYYSIFTLLKHQAFVFCMDQKELGLADIKPDVDLLGLHRNPDVDFGEDNWSIDNMTEEKVKGYLYDTINLLKEQAREAKIDADQSKSEDESYNNGHFMAYRTAISLMKEQALAFNITQREIGLVDV